MKKENTLENINLYNLLHATYDDKRVKDGRVTSQSTPEDTLVLQLQDQQGEVVGTIYANVADRYPDSLLYTLYQGYGTVELEQWHYDFSEDDTYETGARNIVDECMNGLKDFDLIRGGGNA